jgi:type IV secretory pathway TraG/TraD family ATPase VirD4
MSQPGGVPDPEQRVRDFGLLAVVCLLWLVGGGFWLALQIGARLAGTELPGNPIDAVVGVLSGRIPWPGLGASLALGCELLIVISLVRIGWHTHRARSRKRTRVDGAARLMGYGRELDEYTEAGVAESAARLRPNGYPNPTPAEHGILLGTPIASPRQRMRASWESTVVVLAGPRMGKTRCYVIAQLIEAPGPALVTTLRRDVWDATVNLRRGRERDGRDRRVWNFDPQQLITSDEPRFWVNPLAEVRSIDDARKLKDHFVMGTRGPNATTSAYFDTEGEQLLARLILAAAKKTGGTLLDVYDWVNDSNVIEPVTLLREAGQLQAATGLNKIRTMSAEKQREGVYGSAGVLVSCLENPEVTRWITPPRDPRIPQFDPTAFVRSADTLYLHSREGEGNISPLIAALTQSVFDAGLRRAARSVGGRLDPPLPAFLDEVANVCKIRNLPSLYSYLGGSGMPVMSLFQSFEQGMDVWGNNGMRALFGASTVRVYAGGLTEPDSLRRFTEAIGRWREPVTTVSYDPHGRRSTSHQPQKTDILEISDLANLPKERAVIFAAGIRPALVRPQPWTETEYAPRIVASIKANKPATDDDAEPADRDTRRHTPSDTTLISTRINNSEIETNRGPWL